MDVSRRVSILFLSWKPTQKSNNGNCRYWIFLVTGKTFQNDGLDFAFWTIENRKNKLEKNFWTREMGSHWSCDETEKTLLSVDIVAFLVCARKFICSLAFLFIFVGILWWNTPMWSCVTCELRPSLRHNLMKSVYIYLKKDGVSNDPETFSCHKNIYDLACANTKTSQITRQDRFLWVVTTPVRW